MITYKVETITPEVAMQMLSKNYDGQRILRKGALINYINDMEAGRWNDDVLDPIRITENGELIDGQHRLQAIVKTGTTHDMLVIRGLKEKDFENLDNGAPRQAKDFIDCKHKTAVISLVRALVVWEHTGRIRSSLAKQYTLYGSNAKPTRNQTVDFFENNTEIATKCGAEAQRMYQACPVMNKLSYGFFYWTMLKLHKDVSLSAFVSDWTSDVPTSTAIYSAKAKILSRTGAKAESIVTQFNWLLKAFECFTNGKDKFSFPQGNNSERLIDEYEQMLRKALL